MARFFLFLLALAGLPFAWGVTRASAGVFRLLSSESNVFMSAEMVAAVAGFVVCFALLLVLPSPVRLYVFGHELTHALWGVLFGEKVADLKVGADGGSVTFKPHRKSGLWWVSDAWVTLSPYCFPFYTVLVICAALTTRMFVSPLPWICVWVFAVGATWCFHVFFTLQSVCQRQPDLEEYGHVFSYVVIWIFNVAEVAVAMVCTTEVSWSRFGSLLAYHTAHAYRAVGAASMWLYESVRSLPFLQS